MEDNIKKTYLRITTNSPGVGVGSAESMLAEAASAIEQLQDALDNVVGQHRLICEEYSKLKTRFNTYKARSDNEIRALKELSKERKYVADPKLPKVDHFQCELERLIDKYTVDSLEVLGVEPLNYAELVGVLEIVKHGEIVGMYDDDEELSEY